jgi:hypothetical protein
MKIICRSSGNDEQFAAFELQVGEKEWKQQKYLSPHVP